MATNMFKKYTESLVREWDVPSATTSGAAVLEANSLRPGVTITGRGDTTKSQSLPDGTTLSGIPAGGIGNRPTGAAVAVDGTWLFTVATVTNGTTSTGGAGTDKGTSVYAIVSSGAITGLTLISTSNTFFGRIDDGSIVGGIAPVQIGIV